MTEARKPKAKGFFALDVHQFERIREKGLGIEEAATYLCLLKSTDQTNVTSVGGINSITTYTGLSRAEARKATQRLEQHDLIQSLEVKNKRARTASRYNLPIHDSRPSLAPMERPVVEAIASGQQPQGKIELNAAQRAKDKGYIEKRSDGWHVVEHTNEVAFIPNSFVQVSKGPSPLARLVNNGELGPIMLAAELYRLQNLMEERGVPASVLRAYYYANAETQVGRHRLHQLCPGRTHKDPKTGEESFFVQSYVPNHIRGFQDGLWAALEALERAHVVEWTVYSANGKPSGNECAFNRPQRPLGVLRNGGHVLNTPESRPAFLAYLLLCLKQVGPDYISQPMPELIKAWQEASPLIVLENTSVAHVEGVGILRMSHHAATENSTVWYRDLCKDCDNALFFMGEAIKACSPYLFDIAVRLRGLKDLDEAISM